MNSKSAFALATLAASLAGAIALGSSARATEQYAVSGAYCAGGYHVGPHGNCQPDNGYVDIRCPPGWEPHSWPNGNNNWCRTRMAQPTAHAVAPAL
jgi:hypothetical protein